MKTIFIVLDCLRYDYLGCNGNDDVYTPTIDGLSSKGCNFKNHFTAAPWTAPSVSAMVTGIYPHRIKSYKEHISFPDEIKTIFHYFLESNIETASFVKSKNFFGQQSGANEAGYSWNIPDILRWLEQHQDREFFLYLHYWNTHPPYFTRYSKEGWYDGMSKIVELIKTGNPRNIQKAKNIYRASVERASEEFIYAIVEKLDKLNVLEDTLLIITADHGESWGGRIDDISSINLFRMHGTYLYDNVVHIPLILSGPGVPAGMSVDALTRHIDLCPTLLEINQIQLNDSGEFMDIDGLSLMPFLKGTEDSERDCFISTTYLDKMHEMVVNEIVQKFAFRDKACKIIYNKVDETFEFYDLTEDPSEQNNLVNSQVSNFQEYKRKLECYLEQIAFLHEQDSDVLKRQLEDLGYL